MHKNIKTMHKIKTIYKDDYNKNIATLFVARKTLKSYLL